MLNLLSIMILSPSIERIAESLLLIQDTVWFFTWKININSSYNLIIQQIPEELCKVDVQYHPPSPKHCLPCSERSTVLNIVFKNKRCKYSGYLCTIQIIGDCIIHSYNLKIKIFGHICQENNQLSILTLTFTLLLRMECKKKVQFHVTKS